MKMTSEQVLDLVKDMVVATMEMIEIEQKVNLSDVARVKNILGEASNKLGDALREMDDVMETSSSDGEGDIAEGYRRFRQQSVEALQFDDIVAQILDQCTRRGDSMLVSLYRLYEMIETLEADDPYVDLPRMRSRFRREATEHRLALDELDSVKQESLANGDVELF